MQRWWIVRQNLKRKEKNESMNLKRKLMVLFHGYCFQSLNIIFFFFIWSLLKRNLVKFNDSIFLLELFLFHILRFQTFSSSTPEGRCNFFELLQHTQKLRKAAIWLGLIAICLWTSLSFWDSSNHSIAHRKLSKPVYSNNKQSTRNDSTIFQ